MKVCMSIWVKCAKTGAKEFVGEYGYSAVGAVVGATYPAQLKELREKLPHTFFLVPVTALRAAEPRMLRMLLTKEDWAQ